MKIVYKISVFLISLFLGGYFLERFQITDYLRMLLGLFTVFVSFSLAGMIWLSNSRSKDNHSLYLGAVFLLIGYLDLFRILSDPFLPDMITSNSIEKSAFFWFESLFIMAPLFMSSAYIYKDTKPEFINKYSLYPIAILLSIFGMILALFHPHLPEVRGVATFALLVFSSVILLFTAYLYSKRIKKTGEKHLQFLIYGSIFLIISNFVSSFFDFSGSLIKSAAFLFIYIALYKTSVENPYEMLVKTKKMLHENELYLHSIVNNMLDGLIVFNEKGEIQSFNQAAERNFGYQAKEVTGKNIHILIPDIYLLGLRQNGSVENLDGIRHEAVGERKDKTTFPIEISISQMSIDDDHLYIGIIRDISTRKEAEESLRASKEEAEKANLTKSDFISRMSHELRTPLNAIIGFSEILKQKLAGDLNEKQEKYIGHIIGQGTHLLNLINDILDMNKIQTGKMELTLTELEIEPAIDEILDMIKEKAKKRGITINKVIDDQLRCIEADRNAFRQVLYNLLDNAVKFSKPEGGIITIDARKDGENARFSVSDNGIGIKEEDMNKLFKMFMQLDSGLIRKYGGTGLGLAISKELIKLHGGTIMAESKYGVGSTFIFVLPLKRNDNLNAQEGIKENGKTDTKE